MPESRDITYNHDLDNLRRLAMRLRRGESCADAHAIIETAAEGLERFIADVVAGAIRPVATFLRCDGHGCGVRVDAPPATTADAMRRAWAVLGWQYTADGYDLCPACADKLPVA